MRALYGSQLSLDSSNPDQRTRNCRVDRLNDELLLVVLSYSQRIGADRIVDERAKVVDMCSDPLAGYQILDYVNRIRLIHYLEWSAMFG